MAYLAPYSLVIQDVVVLTRDLVREVLPGLIEAVHPRITNLGFPCLLYGFGPRMKEHVCYITATKQYARLGFFNGPQLPDPDGILEGQPGKLLRHVKLHTPADVDAARLTPLLRATLALVQAGLEA